MADLRGRLGARLRQLRQARKLTQEALAERAGLSFKFIGEVERGRGNPTLTTLASISEALGVGLVDLLALDPDRPRLTSRQASQVRDALASLENLVEWAAPADVRPPAKARRRR